LGVVFWAFKVDGGTESRLPIIFAGELESKPSSECQKGGSCFDGRLNIGWCLPLHDAAQKSGNKICHFSLNSSSTFRASESQDIRLGEIVKVVVLNISARKFSELKTSLRQIMQSRKRGRRSLSIHWKWRL
jgi:hypothetical protein